VSLRVRLAVIAAGLTLAGLVIGLLLMFVLFQQLSVREVDQELVIQAETVLTAAIADPNNEIPLEVEDDLTRETGVSSTLIYRNRKLVFAAGALNVPDPLDPVGLQTGQNIATVGGWRVHTTSRGGLTVQVGRPLAPLQRSLQRYIEIALPLAGLVGLLSGGLAWLFVSLALRNLEELTQATRKFESGVDVPTPRGQDEVATLAHSFKNLLQRLREQRTREQRFLSYAAHELRTPISAFRANLEAARFKSSLDSAQLRRMHHEALRLETLAQNLLALSRAESGEVRNQQIDLADLVSEAFDRFQPLALERGLEIEMEAHPAPVQGDPGLIEQALNNLIHNALRYSDSGTVILRSGMQGNKAWLEVSDQGPGLPQNLHEGLGLRVAKSVAEAFGGDFSIQSNQGTRARLEFQSMR